jgi:hypothetical protein
MKHWIPIIGLLSGAFFAAQPVLQAQQVKALTKETAMNFDSQNDLTKATIQTETEKTAGVQLEFKGFNKPGKVYVITAKILNQIKTPMKEFEPVTVDLDARAGSADFFFTFVQRPGVQYDPMGIESRFIEFAVIDKSSATNIPGLESLGLNSTKFVFRFQKKWKVKVSGQEVTVKLTPFKSAATIKP